jgi:hypothetical protein
MMRWSCFSTLPFQAPNVSRRLRIIYTFGVTISARFRSCELFDNKSRADHPDAVLPFSFSMSSSATLLLRTPGNQETVKKIHTPMGPATNFATALLQRRWISKSAVRKCRASSGDNALNQRIDSPPRHAAFIVLPQCSIFFSPTARILRRRGVFQLPSASFPLKACGRGRFSDQKFRLARNEQIDRAQRSSTKTAFAKARLYARRTFARSYVELGR